MPIMVSHFEGRSDMGKPRILLLGGTTEARQLAERLAADPRYEATISLAGRTLQPRSLPLPVRMGGFGGAEGLARYLSEEGIDLLIDATHPFANRISANAAQAATLTGTPLFALRRPGWQRQPGDRWTGVGDLEAAVDALGDTPRRVFLAIGRQEAHVVNRAPQHAYLVRSVDPVEPPLTVPQANYILATGPFSEEDERALLAAHRIDVIVTKNSGGTATYGKLAAARALGIEVVMVERLHPPEVAAVATVTDALDRIDHLLSPAMKRGV